ncbi:septum formation inhibitor Maf [Vibrio sp. V27_P1S3P104]|uniref:Maf family protein n=1 Tax=Vibrio TaxID=662 RepID=UPI000C173622|nr:MULTISPECIES: Maf family protein [Vibrio]NAW70251.1 septum formation inhibitor Maf [Vibrio sp. V28_P6S34P95]NAX03779.1 septum formation inhibitor Maf [Vibrio sp. V30_P3S12P165]NAX33532.1 septum formation inhibitor Maf [Vibrio sp. V29_P1S30P107]NAX38646.1 septum formation inhibitor Maf [Vibrio sp. V27_P1S3P104]NAX39144.1 septum formation inhibitor Maf [Vibrio sp. V26_P1S5P106]
MSEKKLVLASGSPRRRELLTQLGYSFDIVVPNVEESRQVGETPRAYVERLSQDKAYAGLTLAGANAIVIGSDTIVVLDDQVLEKPSNFIDAHRMLQQLSQARHQVMTAVTVATMARHRTVVVTTDVWFKPLSEHDIEQYWQSGEPCDKAGSYAIQGLGGKFVTRIEGSYYAVVGLPLYETDQLLHEFL